MKWFLKIKNNKSLLISLIITLVCLLIVLVFFIIKMTTKIEVKLIGKENVSIALNKEYVDKGFVVKKNNKIVKRHINYETNSNVNKYLIGEYEYKYTIRYRFKKYELVRKVTVEDKELPVITIDVKEVDKDYCTNKIKTKYEYSAIDNYDGDITKNVKVEEKDNELVFSVSDSSKNEAIKKIPIKISSKVNDVFKLNGQKTVYIALNSTYKDAGVTYNDGCGAKKEATTSGTVDTANLGEYTITYQNADKTSTLKRKVVVYDPATAVQNPNASGKVLYLTFDDGPCVYTQQVLNTLAKYGVKATFFVTNQFPAYVYLIGAEHSAGHAVGVHSYTHSWNIYYSLDNYLNDFNNMNSVIASYTGSPATIFRFPGGSSNTISRKYSAGIVSAVASYMTNAGYVYFDWDVSSGDAGGASESQIYNNVVNGAARCSSCVILMHDIKKNTVNQLDNILNTLVSQGYQFGTLTPSSPTAHQRIVN